ncbi:MAG: 16S rRNA (guanine(527)-N(7))-methyltransferase RsmG [Clostridia bacterium]|nr:16S rRNA (guanine(527)-N(7))-methyltransferase RsmG [Clostridia bacterium]
MDKMEYFKAIRELFCLNGLDEPSDEVAGKLYELSDCLLTTNKIHNLTAIKEEEDVIVKHFIDSIFLSRALPESSSVVDIGCGPGFPSLPLAIYRPDITVLGVDSTSKKINFVNLAAKALELDNITAISARAESVAREKEHREAYDVATARAVAALPVLCELCLPFVKLGGLFVAMKAQSAEEELAASKNAIEKCGGAYLETIELELLHRKAGLPLEKRNLILIKKIKHTPENYPRDNAKISKKPL